MIVADELDLRGGFLPQLQVITATGAVSPNVVKVIVSNGATAITITLPPHVAGKSRMVSLSRGAGSTGGITVRGVTGNIQALAGAWALTTTMGLHSAAGAGVDIQFWSDGTNWYR